MASPRGWNRIATLHLECGESWSLVTRIGVIEYIEKQCKVTVARLAVLFESHINSYNCALEHSSSYYLLMDNHRVIYERTLFINLFKEFFLPISVSKTVSG